MSQNQVEIYVRSSALGGVGIHWRNISKPEQPTEEPVVLKQRVIAKDNGKKVTINSLINDTKPSLILARYENKMLLEVTGLDAPEARSLKMGRRISEIVLWVGDASLEVESQLRKLAVCALLSFWQKESSFLATIRGSINFDGQNSFKVNNQKIEHLYTHAAIYLDELLSAVSPSEVDAYDSVWLTPTTIDIDTQLYNLAKQISQTSLPETEQPVVIVAEFKRKDKDNEQQIVYKGNVWKAPPIIQPVEEAALPLQEEPELESQKKTSGSLSTSGSRPTNRLISVGIILLIVIILLILWMSSQPKKPSTPTPTDIPQQISPNKTINPQSLPQPVSSLVLREEQPQSFQTLSPDA